MVGSELSSNLESYRADYPEVFERVHLLIVCISDAWGGLEKVAVSDAIEFSNLGLKVSCLALEGSLVAERIQAAGHITLKTIDYRPRNFLDLSLRRDLSRLIDEGINLIHVHQTTLLGSVAPWLWKHRGVGLVATRHIMNNHNKRDPFHRALYARLDSLLVMSEALRQNVLATHPMSRAHVRKVSLGIDFSRFDPASKEVQAKAQEWRKLWGASDTTIVIGLVGRIDPAKGQATFIRAARTLLTEGKRADLKFVIVGEETRGADVAHLQELKNLVTEFGTEREVIFQGYQEDIPSVMAAFDIFVMPSREEAFGLVAIEAMAMEKPVVISNRGSAREIVGQNEEYGFMVRPDDAFDLARRLRELLSQSKRRKQMGVDARGHVLRTFDRRIRIDQSLEVYQKTLKRRIL